MKFDRLLILIIIFNREDQLERDIIGKHTFLTKMCRKELQGGVFLFP